MRGMVTPGAGSHFAKGAIVRWIVRFLHDDTAATTIEYCIVLSVILVAVTVLNLIFA